MPMPMLMPMPTPTVSVGIGIRIGNADADDNADSQVNIINPPESPRLTSVHMSKCCVYVASYVSMVKKQMNTKSSIKNKTLRLFNCHALTNQRVQTARKITKTKTFIDAKQQYRV